MACGLYVLNRWWLRDHAGGAFLHSYFNDLLLVPASLPIVLWVQRYLGVRSGNQQPRWREIGLHLLVWSVAAEVIMPHFTLQATGDWRDVLAYAAGAAGAGCWWHAGATAG